MNEACIYKEFKDKFNISVFEPLNKGLSGDYKFYIETTDGQRLLLRISEIEEYNRKKAEYDMLERAAVLGIPMSMPIKFGQCNNASSVYQLLEWVDGEDLEHLLPKLSETKQYVCGLKAGKLLKKINTLYPSKNAEPWAEKFWIKAQRRIEFYNKHNIKSENGDLIINFLQENKKILENRPQTFVHGDFNISNLIKMPNGEIGVIDFNCFNGDYGDPWWDMFTFIWGRDVPEYFYTGLINGYFNGKPTTEFFKVLSFYLAYDALAALCDTSINEQGEPQDGQRHMANVLLWLDNMNNLMPTWYLKDFYIQWTDGVPYKLKKTFDFSFLSKYGKVFNVFDDQDSGNICFGVVDGEEKHFVKFAGAPTQRSNVTQNEAIERMRGTVQIYKDLSHPILTNLHDAEEIGGGMACVFSWYDAECMGRQYPQSREQFLQILPEEKLQVFDDILSFHAHVVKQNYVAIDFYDGCIMYDFNNKKTIICDIELYEKAPVTNKMGRMYGSSRFMSPEEYQLGATIDEVTNVYTMGATAFALFGDERDRSFEKWTLSKALYDIAKQAVCDERNHRQQSIRQFINEWSAAKC